jgi:glycosyltransferase involved in cell wall biosynthesis
MKITHLLLNYYPSVGGTQIFYKGVSESCVKDYNDEVEVLTVDSYYGSHSKQYKEIKNKNEIVNGVTVKRFPFLRKHKPLFIFLNKIIVKLTGKPSTLLQLYITGPWSSSLTNAINTSNADVISASSIGYLYMLYPLYRHKLKHPKPFVFQGAIHFTDDETHQPVSKKMLAAIKASEFYLCNTSFEKNKLKQLGVHADKIVVTGCPVNVQQFSEGNGKPIKQQLNIEENNIVVGYIGRLEVTKSIPVLIKAFVSAFKNNNRLQLVIAGFETEYLKELKNIVQHLDAEIKSKIHFLISITEQEKINLYHAIDILVLPSVNESFGMVFLEAWSCKKPVIGTAIGAIRSVIDNEEDGLLMQPHNATDLSDKIIYLANNKLLRDKMGEKGYQKVIQNYTWEIVTQKFRDTYLSAIEKFKRQ